MLFPRRTKHEQNKREFEVQRQGTLKIYHLLDTCRYKGHSRISVENAKCGYCLFMLEKLNVSNDHEPVQTEPKSCPRYRNGK